jgi:type II secretory pathway pseudopilin PulG
MRHPRLAPPSAHSGFSTIDILIVVALIGVLSALAVPQMISQRRLIRSAAFTREIITQIRLARQQAMSQREAVTLQYNQTQRQLVLIEHNASGPTVLADPGYPNTAGSSVIRTTPLAVGGLPASEISYGIPAGLPTGALDDGVTRTALSSSKVNITFQPDGSVIDANGNPLNRALFLYNSKAPNETAAAISVLGAAGRVKLWRYNSNVNKYVE